MGSLRGPRPESALDHLGLSAGKQAMNNRRGFTMIELLVVISVISVILPLAGGTIVFLLRAQSQSAEALRDAMATTQLSHSLRSDVHAARSASSSSPDEVSLELDGSRII